MRRRSLATAIRTPLAAALLASLALLPAALLAGCVTRHPVPPVTDYLLAEGFGARRPADVAVLPVEGNLPPETAEALREALRRGLLERRFAPVRSKEVGARPGEFRPGGANAVMTVSVETWGDADLYGAGTVKFSGEVRLFLAGSPEPVYRATLRDVVVSARMTAHSMEDRPRTVARAAEETVVLLLARLPVKGDG